MHGMMPVRHQFSISILDDSYCDLQHCDAISICKLRSKYPIFAELVSSRRVAADTPLDDIATFCLIISITFICIATHTWHEMAALTGSISATCSR